MEISSQKTSIWVLFVISIPLTLLAFIVLANWESLKEALMYLFARRSYKYARSRRERWKGLLRLGVYRLWTFALKIRAVRNLLWRRQDQGKATSQA